jgi:hypothetical protein
MCCRRKIEEQLMGKHSRHRVTTPDTKLFIQRTLEKKNCLQTPTALMQTGNKSVTGIQLLWDFLLMPYAGNLEEKFLY